MTKGHTLALSQFSLLLDLTPNPRFSTFLRRGRVSQYLREQGIISIFEINEIKVFFHFIN